MRTLCLLLVATAVALAVQPDASIADTKGETIIGLGDSDEETGGTCLL